MPRFRTSPEDFEVEERPLYPPDGDGPFLWLWIEKRGLDTAELARRLAEACDLPRREVGWAGRKDRHAVTRQAMTVPASAEKKLQSFELDGATVLETTRTRERLRAGQLIGNRFRLTLREVEPGQAADAIQALDRIAVSGLANRFGAQRYGKDGRNDERGRKLLFGGRVGGDRRRAFLMISALQSRVFDDVLKRRPIDNLWPGDLALHHKSGDWRWVDNPADFEQALRRFEVSPTGPIFGTKVKRTRGKAAELEEQVMAEHDLPPMAQLEPPKGLRIFGDRRALRVLPGQISHSYDAQTQRFEVRFDLPAGSYATVLLEELFPDGLVEGPATDDAITDDAQAGSVSES